MMTCCRLNKLSNSMPNMLRRPDLPAVRILLRWAWLWFLTVACASLGWCQSTVPKLIDCHVHHNGSEDFLQKLADRLNRLQGLALLITMPRDVNQVSAFMKSHPGSFVGLGQVDLDAPDVLD